MRRQTTQQLERIGSTVIGAVRKITFENNCIGSVYTLELINWNTDDGEPSAVVIRLLIQGSIGSVGLTTNRSTKYYEPGHETPADICECSFEC